MFLSTIWRGFSLMASKEKISKTVVKIGTHSGVFHCDEVLACFMLKLLPAYQNAEIIRTRDPVELQKCDIVVDVGAEYNPKCHRYDHHQRSFNETLSTVRPDLAKEREIKLSSAGLVYAHFGIEVLKVILAGENYVYTPEDMERIFLAVYDGFVEEIDAIDNGVPMYAAGTPRYRIDTHLSARVHHLNPEWNETETQNLNELFQQAMRLVGSEFRSKVKRIGTVWFPARNLVQKAFDNRNTVHKSGEIIELNERCPWKQHLLDIEAERGITDQIKFAIYHESLSDTWRVQGIPLQPDSFICRVFLHTDWQGVRDEELSHLTDIPDCIFCHASGFIGGNKTREGALKMALKSIEASQSS